MCGRYVTISKIQSIEKRFHVQCSDPSLYQISTNVSPGQLAPIITDDKPSELQFFQFGFTPSWAKKQFYVINARSEGDFNKDNDPQYHGAMGIIHKPMFRKSIRSQRCLVVADAFYEGPKKEKLSKPHLVYLQNGKRPFAFAGIWDKWVNEVTGEVIHSFAIITTQANALMQWIGHHRSPVVLPRTYEQAWLSGDLPLSEVSSMLKPFPARKMNAYPVSTEVKNPKHDGLELLKPVGQRIYKEYDYFLYEDYKLEGMGSTTARQRKLSESQPDDDHALPESRTS